MQEDNGSGLNSDFFKARPRGAPSIRKPRKRRFPPTDYHASAVHFSGQTKLISSSMLGVVNGPKGILSWWCKQAQAGKFVQSYGCFLNTSDWTILTVIPEGPNPYVLGTDTITVQIVDPLFTNFQGNSFPADAGGHVIDVDTWDHIMLSWDCGFTAGQKRMALYRNRQKIDLTINDVADAFDVLYNGTNTFFSVGFYNEGPAFPDASAIEGDLADMYFDATHSIAQADGSILDADLDKFVTAGLKPVYLGADGSLPFGTAPTFLLSGNKDHFADNLAGTGVWNVVGDALTNASSSPSD